MLKANYHTHTPRCHHAKGEEREYIEKAIENGLTTLGFSDHSLQFYNSDFVSGIRMLPEDFPDYVDTLMRLKSEYADRINILIGLEAEYFPATFPKLKSFLQQYPIDYLILGQHYSYNEDDGEYLGYETFDEDRLIVYTQQVLAGIKSGCFAYVAHPDLVNYVGDDKIYETYARLICEAAKEADMPLEINLLGILGNRHYPSYRFFKVAAEVGNTVILGIDAHTPEMMDCQETYDIAMKMVDKLGLNLTDKIKLSMR